MRAAWLLTLVLGMTAPAVAATAPSPAAEMLKSQPGNDALAVAAAREAMQGMDYNSADRYLTACIAAPGDHRLAKTELGWLRYLQDRPAEALDLLKAAEAPGPALPLAQGRLAWVYAQRGLRSDAIRVALLARKAPEGTPLALLTLGLVADDPAKSRQYLLDAAGASRSSWPHYYLGTKLKGAEALKAYAESFARSRDGHDPFEMASMAKSLAAVNDLINADAKLADPWADVLDALVAKAPEDPAISDMLIEARIRSGKQEYAIAELRRRLGWATNKPEILRQIAKLYVALQQDELALDAYERMLKLLGIDQRSPLAHEARCERVALLMGAGRETEADVELDRILKEAPDNRRAKLLKGLLMSLREDWPKADEAIKGVEPVSGEERLIVNMIRYHQKQKSRWAQIFGSPL